VRETAGACAPPQQKKKKKKKNPHKFTTRGGRDGCKGGEVGKKTLDQKTYTPSDWPSTHSIPFHPHPRDKPQGARYANNGAYPPDLSLITKVRTGLRTFANPAGP
jgi:hypothetical protein